MKNVLRKVGLFLFVATVFAGALDIACFAEDVVGTRFWQVSDKKEDSKLQFEVTKLSTESNEVAVYDFNDDKIGKILTIPETVKHDGTTYTVTTINMTAFSGENPSMLESVTIPETIRSIGREAFYGCEKLKEVQISVEGENLRIFRSAFENCGALKSIILPDRVVDIDINAFGYTGSTPSEHIKNKSFIIYGTELKQSYIYATVNELTFKKMQIITGNLELDASSILPVVGQKPKLLNPKINDDRYSLAGEAWIENVDKETKEVVTFEEGHIYKYGIALIPAEGCLFDKSFTITLKNIDWEGEPECHIMTPYDAAMSGGVTGIFSMASKYKLRPDYYDLGEYVINLTDGKLVVTDEKAMKAIESTNIALIKEGQVDISIEGTATYIYDMDKNGSKDVKIVADEDSSGNFLKAEVSKLETCSVTEDQFFEITTLSKNSLKDYSRYFYSKLSIILNKRDISKAVIFQIPEQTYTGAALTPDFTVTYDGKTLVKDLDYTVAYSDNTKAGTAKITITGMGIYEKSAQTSFVIKEAATSDPGKEDPEKIIGYAKVPEKGDKVYDDKDEAVFEITADPSGNTEGTVTYVVNSTQNATTITIAPDVTIHGKKYKVTEIAEGAFKNNKKLKKIIIGKNIKKIGKQAFFGCKSLKTIIIKTTMLKKNTVGAKAFTGIHKKATAKVPAKKLKLYRKVLTKKGMNGKKQKIKAGAK
ncbi:MAG: leucine-rich repeat domain-containing protein [Lachnospiraceae bacterium]|nr:leucine-rich repeat domain-containing protein [Lachnospiraceae bacterium]